MQTCRFRTQKNKKCKRMRKIKIFILKDNEKRVLFQKTLREKISCSGDGEWKDLEENILNAGKEICGMTSGKRGRERDPVVE